MTYYDNPEDELNQCRNKYVYAVAQVVKLVEGPGGIMEMKQTIADKEKRIEELENTIRDRDGQIDYLLELDDRDEQITFLHTELARLNSLVAAQAEVARNNAVREGALCDLLEISRAEIARKDAALREYGGHRQACYYHMGHGCNCGWSAALAPAKEKADV